MQGVKLLATLAATALFALPACTKDDDSDTSSAENFTLLGGGESAALRGSLNIAESETIDPATMNVGVYEFWASENEDCSDPVSVFVSDEAEATNFLDGPTLGAGDLAEGTYPCVIIVMSDQVGFTASEDLGSSCVADEEYELDVCREGSTADLPDGEETTCTNGDDKVAIYLSTVATSDGGADKQNEADCQGAEGGGETDACASFKAPSEDKPLRGFNLAKALVIAGEATSTFIVDGTGKVQEEQGADGGEDAPLECGMQPPTWSFE